MRIILQSIIALSFFVGAFVYAPETVIAQSLVPCSGSSCGTCEMVQLADNVVDFIILISVSIAALVFMWAGYLMLSAGGNAGQIKRGRDVLTDAIIGLVIVLACWLIVDLMLQSLLPNGSVTTGGVTMPWNQVQCSSQNTMSDTPSRFPGDSNWQNVPQTTGGASSGGPINVQYQTGSASNCTGYYNPSTQTCFTDTNNLPQNTGGTPVNVQYQTTSASSCSGYYEPSSQTCYTDTNNLPSSVSGSQTGTGGSAGGASGSTNPLSGTVYSISCNSSVDCSSVLTCPNGDTALQATMQINPSTGQPEWYRQCQVP